MREERNMKIAFSEYDSVVAKRDLSDRVKKGTLGCIVMLHDTENFIVEFFVDNALGNAGDVLTVCAVDIEMWRD